MGLIMHKGEAFGSNGGNSDIIPTNWETYRALQLAGELDPDAYYFVEDIDVSSLLPTLINEPANNNVLVYDGTSGIWKNKMLTADDISYDENTSVEDKLIALTGKFAHADGTMASTINTEVNIPYPQGFTDSSSFIIAGITCRNSNSYWYLNNPDVSCFGDNANVRVKTSNNGFLNQPFKVLLIKL